MRRSPGYRLWGLTARRTRGKGERWGNLLLAAIHEDHRYAGIDAQLPVDESSPAHGDGFRRRVLVRRAAQRVPAARR